MAWQWSRTDICTWTKPEALLDSDPNPMLAASGGGPPNGTQGRRKPGAVTKEIRGERPHLRHDDTDLLHRHGQLLPHRRVASPSSLAGCHRGKAKPVRRCIAGGRRRGSPFSSPPLCRTARPAEDRAKAEGSLSRLHLLWVQTPCICLVEVRRMRPGRGDDVGRG